MRDFTVQRVRLSHTASAVVTPSSPYTLLPVSYREREHSLTVAPRSLVAPSTLETAMDLERPALTTDPETAPVSPEPSTPTAS